MNAPENLRQPPHSVEAEQSLLGALLLDPGCWDRVVGLVRDADFFRDDHRRIFRHIALQAGCGLRFDVTTIWSAIEAAREGDQTGGLRYLGEVANATPSSIHADRYARIVAEKARLRAVIAASERLIDTAQGHTTPEVLIEAGITALTGLAEGVGGHEPVTMTEALRRAVDSISRRHEAGGAISGVPTGFCDLDAKLDGLHAGDLIVVGARPAMGKTAFALNIAQSMAEYGRGVYFFTLEMGAEQLAHRSMASVTGIEGQRLLAGKVADDEWDKLTQSIERLSDFPMVFDDSAAPNVEQICARVRRQKRRTKCLSLVVIDYLQLIPGGAGGDTRNEEISKITRSLKRLARELKITVLLLSQLSRKVEERPNKRPNMADLRESGAIEQDADVILFIYRDEYYRPETQDKGIAEVIVAKQRNGPTGTIPLAFDGKTTQFMNLAKDVVWDETRSSAPQPHKSKAFKD